MNITTQRNYCKKLGLEDDPVFSLETKLFGLVGIDIDTELLTISDFKDIVDEHICIVVTDCDLWVFRNKKIIANYTVATPYGRYRNRYWEFFGFFTGENGDLQGFYSDSKLYPETKPLVINPKPFDLSLDAILYTPFQRKD